MKVRTLDSAGLVLEPLVAAHAREMFAVLSDPEIYEFENEPPESEEALAARYAKLESRRSPDGTQAWLNWAIRLPSCELAGYVQATVLPDRVALVAYELGSRFWRRGIATAALAAVLDELRDGCGVAEYVAVLKARNFRSMGLLQKLGFVAATAEQRARFADHDDEAVMARPA